MSPLFRLMRLDKPIGTLLVLWPVLWALWLANQGIPTLKLLIIFVLGAFIMRSAGCIINDIFDRHLDKHVARTMSRPLVQGELTLKQAWIAFGVLLLGAFLLVLQLNLFTIMIACVAALLVVIYPLCKRFTHMPQLVLGITFNAGVLMAYSASLNHLPLQAWYLFLLSIIWTIAYDTLYAMVDKNDDLKIGIKSTAVLFGRYDLLITTVLYSLFFIGFLALNLGTVFVPFLLLSATWTYYYLYRAYKYGHQTYLSAFKANHMTGLLIFLGISISYI
ncbi:MAG: 4-hydroxybenzoate octaprenyltransferase [Gammaproteobacteria bacterium]